VAPLARDGVPVGLDGVLAEDLDPVRGRQASRRRGAQEREDALP
jgi:hypothetical protein